MLRGGASQSTLQERGYEGCYGRSLPPPPPRSGAAHMSSVAGAIGLQPLTCAASITHGRMSVMRRPPASLERINPTDLDSEELGYWRPYTCRTKRRTLWTSLRRRGNVRKRTPLELSSRTWTVNSEKRRKDTTWTPYFTPSYKYNVRIALAWVLLAATSLAEEAGRVERKRTLVIARGHFRDDSAGLLK